MWISHTAHLIDSRPTRKVAARRDGYERVKAAIQAKKVPGQIVPLFPDIQPSVDQVGSDLQAATKANAKLQADLLRKSSTVVSALLKEGKLRVASAYYDIATSATTLLD